MVGSERLKQSISMYGHFGFFQDRFTVGRKIVQPKTERVP
jgi:hypothetical protein